MDTSFFISLCKVRVGRGGERNVMKKRPSRGQEFQWNNQRVIYLNGICICLGCGCERGNSRRKDQCYLPDSSGGSELNPGIRN